MANACFILKEPLATDYTLIYLLFRYNNTKLKYSTGEKIHPKFWNPEKQRVKETKQYPLYGELNARLNLVESTVINAHRRMINDNIFPTPEMLREELNKKLYKDKEVVKNDLIAFGKLLMETSPKKPNTLKHYKQTVRVLEDYKKHIGRPIFFEDINLSFYDSFMKYCLTTNFGINTIGGLIKNIKVFMNEALDRKLTSNYEFKNRKFKTLDEPVESIYLTKEEIQALAELDLSANKTWDKVRDLFIIGCYTGLRFSDLSKLSEDHFNGDKLKIQTEKTGELVVIPLHPIIKGILAKYDGRPPESITNQKMNEYLKKIGEKAELNSNVLIHFTKGGSKVSELNKKFDLITVHTARRSFATNAFLNGVPTISIMKITGHRTEKAFLRYIKINQEDNASKLASHPFFNN